MSDRTSTYTYHPALAVYGLILVFPIVFSVIAVMVDQDVPWWVRLVAVVVGTPAV
ncbi:hypothetical protein ACFY3U_00100 [Micromonospora sp. NPDC000089]|uniref:hypothetical protein n=1 Tax=unclassified Micromonospora TaxID=2617518 RepID=UPI00368D123A